VSSQLLLLSLSQAAELLGLKPSQLYELTRRRSRCRQAFPLPFVRLGKRIAFRRESLERWIAQLEQGVRDGK
jgi:excisionase family DNA binding protein